MKLSLLILCVIIASCYACSRLPKTVQYSICVFLSKSILSNVLIDRNDKHTLRLVLNGFKPPIQTVKYATFIAVVRGKTKQLQMHPPSPFTGIVTRDPKIIL